MTIKQLKNKSDNWIVRKLRYFAEKKEYWKHYHDFECSPFFRGEELAALNTDIYFKNVKYLNRKIRQLKLLREDKRK